MAPTLDKVKGASETIALAASGAQIITTPCPPLSVTFGAVSLSATTISIRADAGSKLIRDESLVPSLINGAITVATGSAVSKFQQY